MSEAPILASTNPKYDDRLFIELQVQYMKIPSSKHGENMKCTEIVFDIQNNFCTQHGLPMFCKKKSFWQRFTCTFTVKLVLLCMIGLSVAKSSKNTSLLLNGSSEPMIQCSLPFGKISSGGENLASVTSKKIEIKSFPFLASYGYEHENKTWIHICTASIISKTELLTSAHCLRLLEQI